MIIYFFDFFKHNYKIYIIIFADYIFDMTKTNNDIFDNGKKLPLVEQFYTVQGEGYYMGKPAYFIRVGGCDIGCSWCDTKFSWNPDFHKLESVDNIINKAKKLNVDTFVVTGGEPTTYDLNYLSEKLSENNILKHIETSGVYKLTGKWDWVCLSPKKHNSPLNDIFTLANELKVIISDESDFLWAEKNSKRVNSSCKLFLQPEWSKFEHIIPIIVDYVKNNPKWRISLQAHKFMHIP